MTNRQRILAILNYQPYDRMPLLHFGFLWETLTKWYSEGHLTKDEFNASLCADENIALEPLTRKLGFDVAYHRIFAPATRLYPPFERHVVEELPDGSRKVMTADGAIVLEKDEAGSIPMEFDHVLKGRKEWEELFKPRMQFDMERINSVMVNCETEMRIFDQGGREYLTQENRKNHYLLHCGSLYGSIRDYLGMRFLSRRAE